MNIDPTVPQPTVAPDPPPGTKPQFASLFSDLQAGYEAIIEGFDGLIYICSRDYRVLYMNARFIERTGRDATGELCYRALHDLDAVCPWCVNERVFAGEKVRWSLKSPKDGRSYDVTNVPIKLADGTIVKQSLIQDVTERVVAEETIRANAEYQQALFCAIQDGVSVIDTEGVHVKVNNAFCAMTGYTREELIGSGTPHLYWPEEEYPKIQEAFDRLDRGEVGEVELIFKRKSGERFPVIIHPSTVRNRDGEATGYLATIKDITERKRTEDALRRSNARLALLAATTNDLLKAKDPQQVVGALCARVLSHLDCQLFFNFLLDEEQGRLRLNAWGGIPEEEARKIEWLDLGEAVCGCVARDGVRIVAPDIDSSPSPRTELLASYGVKAYACLPLVVQDKVLGTISFGSCTRPRFSDADLATMNAVAEQMAIAFQRKKIEEGLQKAHNELELRVRERTLELQATNQELESFCYSVTHELSAPLRGISCFSSILHGEYSDKIDDAGREFLKRIGTAAVRMGVLVEDLLNLSRVTRRKLNREPADLSGIASQVAATLRNQDPERAVEITVAEDLRAQMDSGLACLALQNLVGNAWKYTREVAAARIEVGSFAEGDETVFFIRDNGIGFAMEYAEKIFQPFERLHRIGSYEGTGIGLATVQRVIARHGGRVWAEAEPGKGATFYFTDGSYSVPPADAPREATVPSVEAPVPAFAPA
ncbi:PAS domain-containing sensor histidine kinase [Geomonas sp. Red276]